MIKNSQKNSESSVSVHRQSLLKNLLHRLEVARANGDEYLVAQLEAEAKYLKLNS